MYDSLGDFGSGLVNPGGASAPARTAFTPQDYRPAPSDEILPTHSLSQGKLEMSGGWAK